MATVIICPNDECINNSGAGKGYVCQLDKISLIYRNMATLNEGRVDMWVCKSYEPDEEYKKYDEYLKRAMKQYIDKKEAHNE